MLIGLGLMLYNDLRFNNPFEFGWRYQVNELYRPTTAHQFSLHYFWFNFRYFFLEPVRLNGHFPFLQTVPLPPVPSGYDAAVQVACGGILSNYPLVWLVLAVPLAWRNRPVETIAILRWYVAALFLLFVICMSTLCLFLTTGERYELDFLPALLLLACMGVFGLEHGLASLPAWRRIARWGLCFLAAYSLVFNLLISVETHAEIDYLAGNSSLSLGRVDEAMIQYQKALALWPECANAHCGLGSALLQKGQMDDAMAQYQKALEITPNFPEAHNNLAYCFLKTGRMDDAILQFQKDLEMNPNFAEARNNLAYCFLQTGRVNEAIVQYQKAIELQPQSATFHSDLGNAFFQKGNIDGAITQYQEALALQPQSADVCKRLGDALFKAGRMNEAIIQYQKALEMNPNFAEAHNNLGFCFLRTGRLDDAIVQYRKVVELRPGFAQAYKNLGDAYHRKGMAAEATAAYQKAIELQQHK